MNIYYYMHIKLSQFFSYHRHCQIDNSNSAIVITTEKMSSIICPAEGSYGGATVLLRCAQQLVSGCSSVSTQRMYSYNASSKTRRFR